MVAEAMGAASSSGPMVPTVQGMVNCGTFINLGCAAGCGTGPSTVQRGMCERRWQPPGGMHCRRAPDSHYSRIDYPGDGTDLATWPCATTSLASTAEDWRTRLNLANHLSDDNMAGF